ncbi:MAG TPA: hypothetical protein VG755_04840 [Nannocystaceae bacterium]|nr:hypothetical protein [Nannocystaceae bacterium]
MACDAKILLRITDPGALARVRDAGLGGESLGDWHEIAAADDEATARRLSKSLDLVTVWFSIHSAVELIEIKCFAKGKELRHLLHTADDGWIERAGEPLPFEATAALERWLAVPRVLASVHGPEVLACVLGHAQPPGEHAATASEQPHA